MIARTHTRAPTPVNRWTPAGSAAGIALLALLVSGPAAGAQGLSFDLRTTGQFTDPRTGQMTTRTMMAGHGQFAGTSSRIDISESMTPGGLMGKGTYIIVKGTPRTEFIVDPEKHSYLEVHPDSLAKIASAMQGALGGMVKTEMSDVIVNVDKLGAGETIQGYPTVHYRLTEGYTMRTTMMGRTNRSTQHSTTDLWIAPQLAGLFNPMAGAGAGTSAGGGSYAAYADRIAKAYAKLGPGTPIKSVRQSESTRGGKTSTNSMTMELLNIRRGPVNPAVFEVPAGYTKEESLTGMMGAASAPRRRP